MSFSSPALFFFAELPTPNSERFNKNPLTSPDLSEYTYPYISRGSFPEFLSPVFVKYYAQRECRPKIPRFDLAVNAYVEPVVSLDIDIVIAVKDLEAACRAAEKRGLKVEQFEHSMNLSSSKSDLRIQLQTDPRYQEFIPRAELKDVLGYKMSVASLDDVLRGKAWAYADQTRRRSK